MPAIPSNATRTAFKFRGREVQVPQLYAAGHTMDENDARFANRQLASVLGNVLGSALSRVEKEAREANDKLSDGDPNKKPSDFDYIGAIPAEQVQSTFDKIFTNYKVGQVVSRDGSSLHDPVQSIANNIAWEKIKVLLKARKLRVSSVKADKKAELVKDLLQRDPSILVEAREAYEGATVSIPDSLFAGIESDGGGDSQSAGSDSTTSGSDTQSTVSGGEGNDSVSGNDSASDSVAGSEQPSTIEGGEATPVLTGNEPEPSVDLTQPQPSEPTPSGNEGSENAQGEVGAPAAAEPSDNAVAAPGAVNSGADPAEGATESVPGQDSPGQTEVAPDASAGEKTPPGGAFA